MPKIYIYKCQLHRIDVVASSISPIPFLLNSNNECILQLTKMKGKRKRKEKSTYLNPF